MNYTTAANVMVTTANRTVMDVLAGVQLELNELKATRKETDESLNHFFLVINGMIVYLMQCGFAFLECGAVRSKNATNILIKNVLDSFLGALAYWLIGYPLAYGREVQTTGSNDSYGSSNMFLGVNFWAGRGMPESEYASWMFQFAFAVTAATIVSGAMAERCEFVAYMVYSVVITGFVYPIVTHWAWSADGWLAVGNNITVDNATVNVRYQDFAGSGVVHVTGGLAAIMGAAILGPRYERFDRGESGSTSIMGHSVPLAALGGFVLFFGFFAFNGGSQLTISNPGDGKVVALACMNTMLSAAAASVVTLFTMRLVHKRWSLLIIINAGLTGMVAICAGCNVMYPWAAVLTGSVAGFAYMFWSWIIPLIHVDDPLDAFAVHAGGGMWGVVATALFDKRIGVIYKFNMQSFHQLAWAFIGIAAIAAWTCAICALMFGVLRLVGLLRVEPDTERKGMDIPKHGEPAYPKSAYGHGWDEVEATIYRKSVHLTNPPEVHPPAVMTSEGTDKQPQKAITAKGTEGYLNAGYEHQPGSLPYGSAENVRKFRADTRF